MLSRAENDKKNLIGFVIEQAILEVGGNNMLYDVLIFLYTNYRCYAADCIENPQYLIDALKEHDAKDSRMIISLITLRLDEFAYNKPVQVYLRKNRYGLN